MYKNKLMDRLKRHSFATTVFALYMAFWITVYSMLFFFEMPVGFVALYALIFAIPYSWVILLISLFNKKDRKFFLVITLLIYIPILATIRLIVPMI
jgi:hypothetical protein